jgi:hypothetical protein
VEMADVCVERGALKSLVVNCPVVSGAQRSCIILSSVMGILRLFGQARHSSRRDWYCGSGQSGMKCGKRE